MSKELGAAISSFCGFIVILYGFIQLVKSWIQISDIIGLTIEIEFWYSIVAGFFRLLKIESIPGMYFFPGIVFILIGLIIVLITVIITGLSKEL
ncbi:MAG: hypothetical protein ACFFDN_07205 [Candidatus Hodarchaeota archaeon]